MCAIAAAAAPPCVFLLFQGCKEFVIISPSERRHLHPVDAVPHIPLWSDDVWDSLGQRPRGVAADKVSSQRTRPQLHLASLLSVASVAPHKACQLSASNAAVPNKCGT